MKSDRSQDSANNEIYHVPGFKGPVWLLDVDGVLNADQPGWTWRPRQGIARVNGQKFTITWAPELVDRIWDLHRSGRVEIRWATTWCDVVSEIENLLKLPQFPCESVPMQGLTQVSKINAAIGVIESNRPLIWTDDDAIPVRGFPGWDSRFRHPPAGRLLIAPDQNEGLQPEHMDLIEKYLRMIEKGS